MVSMSMPDTVVLMAKVRMAPTARKKRLIPVAMMASLVGFGSCRCLIPFPPSEGAVSPR